MFSARRGPRQDIAWHGGLHPACAEALEQDPIDNRQVAHEEAELLQEFEAGTPLPQLAKQQLPPNRDHWLNDCFFQIG